VKSTFGAAFIARICVYIHRSIAYSAYVCICTQIEELVARLCIYTQIESLYRVYVYTYVYTGSD